MTQEHLLRGQRFIINKIFYIIYKIETHLYKGRLHIKAKLNLYNNIKDFKCKIFRNTPLLTD